MAHKRCSCLDPTRCVHLWWMDRVVAGQRYHVSINDLLPYSSLGSLSRRQADDVEQSFVEAKRGGHSSPFHFSDLSRQYRHEYLDIHRPTATTDVNRLREWESRLNLVALQTVDVEALLADHYKHVSPATRNRHRDLLSGMFRWAERKGYKTPRLSIGRREKEFHRLRRLLPDEESRLMAALPQKMQDLVVVALDTGLRRGSILSLTDTHIVNEMFVVEPQSTKQRQTQRLPLSERVKKLVVGRSGTLFDWDRHAWDIGRKVAKLSDLRFHDLRREFASRLLERGVPLPTIQRLLGHHSIQMTMRYLHTTDMDSAFRDAIKVLA